METEKEPRQVVRFGIFDLDVRARSVHKSGIRIKLQGQPFDILVLLISRRGEVVTREELQRTLRPADTFVDFEHSVNTAVMRLRDALGDSAESPRFIETVPRYGYRFIAPMEWELDQQSKHRYVSPYDRALIYIGLGENDQALAWLEKAEEQNVPLHHINVDRRFNSLRSDKRYQQLLRRIGFPP